MSLLGDKLRELRGAQSLHEVAAELGVDTSVISRYENDKRTPVPEMLHKLADYYEVEYASLRDLYYDEAIPDPEEQAILLKWAAKKLGYPEELLLLIERLSHLDPAEAQKLMAQLVSQLPEK